MWLDTRNVDPASAIRYESLWRLHVGPEFGRRSVGSIRPSQIEAFLTRLSREYGKSTAAGAYLVLQGILGYAVADGLIKVSPAKADAVTKPRGDTGPKLVAWSDDQAEAVIAAHPADRRLVAVLMAATGLRIGEALWPPPVLDDAQRGPSPATPLLRLGHAGRRREHHRSGAVPSATTTRRSRCGSTVTCRRTQTSGPVPVIDARMKRRRNVAGARLRLVRPDERPPLARPLADRK
jgi:hypothetical protein